MNCSLMQNVSNIMVIAAVKSYTETPQTASQMTGMNINVPAN